jgi:BlaI family transcriptional regulator, penicillinase repressor
MAEPRRSTISETELDILKVLWDHGPGTVRQVNALLHKQGRRWAYTTVLTLLQRLETKGYVASDKSGLAHVFRPALSRDRLLRQRLKDLANQLCEGTATPLVLALVEGQRFTTDEIQQFRELLDRLEGQRKRGQGTGN